MPRGRTFAVRPRSALRWVGFLVTALFIYLIVRKVDVHAAVAAARDSNPLFLLPAFVWLAIAVFLRAVRWRYLFDRATRPPLGAVVDALLIGYLFNNLLPARAGEAARVVALHRSSASSRAVVTATVVVERAFDVITLVALLFAASPWLPSVSWAGSAAIFAGVVGLACVILVAGLGLWGPKPVAFLFRPLALLPFLTPAQIRSAATNLVRGIAAFRRPRIVVGAIFWTTLSWFALAISTWFVLRAFDLGLSPLAGLLCVIAINLAMILPSSPAAVGVFEAATLVALSAYDVPRPEALSAAVILHLLNLVPYLVAGAIVLQLQLRRQGPGGRPLLRGRPTPGDPKTSFEPD
ncbi:MAG TPA: lysylphosphatidylglycerol synthase transmembrane domain-containing protein [Gaiellaceae bacterium]